MIKNNTLPTLDRPCPKCGNDKVYGPEFRRGTGTDEGLGEHLRFYCTVCRYLTAEPTRDTDTPERRAELVAAFAARLRRPHPDATLETNQLSEWDRKRQRDIASVRQGETSRRPYGWTR